MTRLRPVGSNETAVLPGPGRGSPSGRPEATSHSNTPPDPPVTRTAPSSPKLTDSTGPNGLAIGEPTLPVAKLDDDRSVGSRHRDGLAVRCDRQGAGRGPQLDGFPDRSAAPIPPDDAAVGGNGDEGVAGRNEGEAGGGGGKRTEVVEAASGPRFEQPDGATLLTHGQQLTVRRQSDGRHSDVG